MGDYMSEIENNDEFKSKTLGDNIKGIRKKVNCTQDNFSEKLEVTPQFLSAVERGTAGISLKTAINICNAANCSANMLFKDIITIPKGMDKYEFLSDRDKIVINEMIEVLLKNK